MVGDEERLGALAAAIDDLIKKAVAGLTRALRVPSHERRLRRYGHSGMHETWVGLLITQRSEVQILPPLPRRPLNPGDSGAFACLVRGP